MIKELVHRLALCAQRDVVADSATMELRRTGVVWTWGRIKSHYGLPVFMGQAGYSIMDPTTRPTHAITIRSGLGIQISDTAYVYEEFRRSPPRWYKVLGYSEPERWTVLTCRLMEKSDYAITPQTALAPHPSQVEL